MPRDSFLGIVDRAWTPGYRVLVVSRCGTRVGDRTRTGDILIHSQATRGCVSPVIARGSVSARILQPIPGRHLLYGNFHRVIASLVHSRTTRPTLKRPVG